MSNLSLFSKFKHFVAVHYGDGTGKMLIHTGVIGWVLSSAAQIFAILINDKIPKEQKMFLIPQEAADAFVNIFSFYAVTQSFKSLTNVLVKTGKWMRKDIKTFLFNNNYKDKIGKIGFDIGKDVNLPEDLKEAYKLFYTGTDVSAMTLGSILSCNIITPLIRNLYASKRQKQGIAKMNSLNPPATPIQPMKRPSFNDFQSNLNRGSLKI